MPDAEPRPEVIERRESAAGELVLRRAGDHFEVIADGTFLMDTRGGRSERALVACALAGTPAARLLLGGLGVGFSLDEALRDPTLREVVVVEAEPEVVRWARTHLRALVAHGLEDARVQLCVGDLVDYVRRTGRRFDAICLDVDNGPEWVARPGNARLYTPAGLALLASRLRPGGRLAVWSAAPSAAFAERLRGVFADVRELRFPAPRGPDDAVYVASGRRAGGPRLRAWTPTRPSCACWARSSRSSA